MPSYSRRTNEAHCYATTGGTESAEPRSLKPLHSNMILMVLKLSRWRCCNDRWTSPDGARKCPYPEAATISPLLALGCPSLNRSPLTSGEQAVDASALPVGLSNERIDVGLEFARPPVARCVAARAPGKLASPAPAAGSTVLGE
jgi:hypothetical protein